MGCYYGAFTSARICINPHPACTVICIRDNDNASASTCEVAMVTASEQCKIDGLFIAAFVNIFCLQTDLVMHMVYSILHVGSQFINSIEKFKSLIKTPRFVDNFGSHITMNK